MTIATIPCGLGVFQKGFDFLCLGRKQGSAAEQHNVTKHKPIIERDSFEAYGAVSTPSAAKRGSSATGQTLAAELQRRRSRRRVGSARSTEASFPKRHTPSGGHYRGPDCGWAPAIRSPSVRDTEKRSAIGTMPPSL